MHKLNKLIEDHFEEVQDQQVSVDFNDAILNRISEKSKSFKYLLDIIAVTVAIFLISIQFIEPSIDLPNSDYQLLLTLNKLSQILLNNTIILYSILALYVALYMELILKKKEWID